MAFPKYKLISSVRSRKKENLEKSSQMQLCSPGLLDDICIRIDLFI